jgi:hypothetical protein
MSRLFVITLTLMVAFALFISSASAGGWATIVFDPLPEDIHAGDTVTVRFIVRQHGNDPVHTAFGKPLVATVNIRTTPDGKSTSVEATPDTEVGYYTAQVTFAEQGDYELLVTTNALDTTQVAPNPLNVSVSAAAEPVVDTSMQKAETLVAGTTATTPSGFSPMVMLAGIGIVLLLGIGTIAVVRTR